jgi:hypothetical protein
VEVGGVEGLDVLDEAADAAGELDAAREAASEVINDAALSADDSCSTLAIRNYMEKTLPYIVNRLIHYASKQQCHTAGRIKDFALAVKKVPVSASAAAAAAAAAASCSAAAAALEISVSRRGKYFFLMFSVVFAANVPERSQISTTRFTFSYKVQTIYCVWVGRECKEGRIGRKYVYVIRKQHTVNHVPMAVGEVGVRG